MSGTTLAPILKSKAKKLTDLAIRQAKPGDAFARANGLQLKVGTTGIKRWLFKYKPQGIARGDEKVCTAYQNTNTFRAVALEWLD